MGKAELTLDETKQMLIAVARGMQDSKDILTEADQLIGDGDHGIGMARGFESVRQRLTSQDFDSLEELFKATGTALMSSMGGASGAVFGTFFRGGSKSLVNAKVFDSAGLALLLRDGLQAVQERGKARPGDKTMIDALDPGARRAAELVESPLDEALKAVEEAAHTGMERTREMVAATGKARTLGERSLGHADPGAISTWLIFKFMRQYVMSDPVE